MKRAFTVITPPRPNPQWDHAREEQLHSLLDGRARWPDGTVREIGVPLFEKMQEKVRVAMREDA